MINHSPAQLIAELRRLMDMDYERLPGARHVLEEAIAVILPLAEKVSDQQLRLHAQEMRDAAYQRPEVMQVYLRKGAELLESFASVLVVSHTGGRDEPCQRRTDCALRV